MPDVIARVASLLLATVFLWAAAAKLLGHAAWRRALAGYRLPRPVQSVAGPAIPLVETLVAGLFLVGAQSLAVPITLALLGGFSLALLRARDLHGDRVPCGCFGGSDTRSYRVMLWRNAVLALLVALAARPGRDLAPLEGLAAPARADALPIALALTGVVLGAWAIHHTLGSLHRRGGS